MKARIKNLFVVPALIASLGLILAGGVMAQTFTTLHSFTPQSGPYPYTNSDGALPFAGLILSGNTLYGTAIHGGSLGYGTVFKVNTGGAGFTTLHNFSFNDGAYPHAGGLILSGNTLYGTASGGGGSRNGTVFKVSTEGTGFTILHSFAAVIHSTNSDGDEYYVNIDGAEPYGGMILSGNSLYGTAAHYGSSGSGTVFKINTDGTGFTNLHSFAATVGSLSTNSDGANPVGGLILSGDTLYGTALLGGSLGHGTVFAVNTDGTGFTNLHTFTAISSPFSGTNSDGANPDAGLILSANTLFGTARRGGTAGNGAVFAVNTDGTGFTILHDFTATSGSLSTNNEGANPHGLILSGNTLYGTVANGGTSGNGTVFAVNTDGTGFTALYSFTALYTITAIDRFAITNSDGAHPSARLILSSNTLYGTAQYGGSWGYGTAFSLSLASTIAPQLTTVGFAANVVLTWPTNTAGFTLQSTTNLVPPTVWSTVFPAPVIVNGHNTVTNPISGTKQFYRLTQ